MVIRWKKFKDYPSILKITRDSFPGFRRMIFLIFPAIVAEENAKVIGFLSFSRKKQEIVLMAVDERYRDNKIGTKLLNSFLNYLENRRLEICFVKTRTDESRSINFYQKNNFQLVESVSRTYLGDAYLFQRKLKRNNSPFGIISKKEALGRQKKFSWKYRIRRRTDEVLKYIKTYAHVTNDILDIGTAEGLMLRRIKKEYPNSNCIGLEYSQELIDLNKNKDIKIIQGDAQHLPFLDNSFDIVISTAVIEHLDCPYKMVSEAYRVLKKNGILIVTTPDPFFDKIAHFISHDVENHIETFNIEQLKKLFKKQHFQIMEAQKFMVSPCGLPFELKIERLLLDLDLDFLMINQIIVGKK